MDYGLLWLSISREDENGDPMPNLLSLLPTHWGPEEAVKFAEIICETSQEIIVTRVSVYLSVAAGWKSEEDTPNVYLFNRFLKR